MAGTSYAAAIIKRRMWDVEHADWDVVLEAVFVFKIQRIIHNIQQVFNLLFNT